MYNCHCTLLSTPVFRIYVYIHTMYPAIKREIPNSNSVAPNTPDARAVNLTKDWDKITQFHSLCI